MRILQDVQQRAAEVIQALGLPREPLAVVFIIRQNMQHRRALIGQLLIESVEVVHDVNHGAAAILRLLPTLLQQRVLLAQPAIFRQQSRQIQLSGAISYGNLRRMLFYGHRVCPRSAFSFSMSRLSPSISFFRAIIFSSRPTTTSSNFSRSRIFSCNSAFDSWRSRTACSYARMSRKIPMAPITFPSVSRSAEAFRLVGITSPEALRGFSFVLRMTPRSITSRSAAVNSRVSSGEMKRESDCSITSSVRNPSSSYTASLAVRILPSRSETNTGSGAFLIMISASNEPWGLAL